MDIEQAKKFIEHYDDNHRYACKFCPHDNDCRGVSCADVMATARNIIIAALEAEREEANENAKLWFDLGIKQAETILSMRNCGNCANLDDVGGTCFYNFDQTCHGSQDRFRPTGTYLAKWRPGKQVVK